MALVGVLVLSALLMALAVSLAVAVKSDTELRGAFASGVTGFYAAESGLNVGMGEAQKTPKLMDAVVAELRTQGVAVTDPVPVGPGRQAFVTDPAGNRSLTKRVSFRIAR